MYSLRVILPVVGGVMLWVVAVATAMRGQLCGLHTFRRPSRHSPSLNHQLFASTELASRAVLSRAPCWIVGGTYVFGVALPVLD